MKRFFEMLDRAREVLKKFGGAVESSLGNVFANRGAHVTCVVVFVLVIAAVALFGLYAIGGTKWLVAFALAGLFLTPRLTRLVLFVVRKMIWDVPKGYMGIVYRLGKPTGEVVGEGWRLTLPWVDEIFSVPNELISIPFEVEFTSKDGEWMKGDVEVQYRLDPGVRREGRSICVENSKETINEGILKASQEKIMANANLIPADKLRKHVHALSDLLECWLKRSSKYQPQFQENIKVGGLLDFLRTNHSKTKDLIDGAVTSSDRSMIEELYGIDVELVTISKIDWTGETKEAREAERRASLLERSMEKKVEAAGAIIGTGASPDFAWSIVQAENDRRIVPNQAQIYAPNGSRANVFLGMQGIFGGGPRNNDDGRKNKKGGRQ